MNEVLAELMINYMENGIDDIIECHIGENIDEIVNVLENNFKNKENPLVEIVVAKIEAMKDQREFNEDLYNDFGEIVEKLKKSIYKSPEW